RRGPLPDAARHVEDAVGRRARRVLAHRPEPERVPGVGALGLERVAPGIASAVGATGGLLPLGLGREALARPAAVVGRLTPAENGHRVVGPAAVAELTADRNHARPGVDAPL